MCIVSMVLWAPESYAHALYLGVVHSGCSTEDSKQEYCTRLESNGSSTATILLTASSRATATIQHECRGSGSACGKYTVPSGIL